MCEPASPLSEFFADAIHTVLTRGTEVLELRMELYDEKGNCTTVPARLSQNGRIFRFESDMLTEEIPIVTKVMVIDQHGNEIITRTVPVSEWTIVSPGCSLFFEISVEEA